MDQPFKFFDWFWTYFFSIFYQQTEVSLFSKKSFKFSLKTLYFHIFVYETQNFLYIVHKKTQYTKHVYPTHQHWINKSNCSSGLLYFCLLCSNLRQFHPLNGSTFTHSLTLKISDHRFTIKWKSALEQIVKFFWNLLSKKLLYFSFLCTCCLMYHYSNGVSAIGRWK